MIIPVRRLRPGCIVCGAPIACVNVIRGRPLLLCGAHVDPVLWTLLTPADWLDRMLTEGLRDHHTDRDLTRALRLYADRCSSCGLSWYACTLSDEPCCEQCTHDPKGKPMTEEQDEDHTTPDETMPQQDLQADESALGGKQPLEALDWQVYTRKQKSVLVAPWEPGADTTSLHPALVDMLEAGALLVREDGPVGENGPVRVYSFISRKDLEREWDADEEPPPVLADKCIDLEPVNEVRTALLRIHAELRALDPWGSTYANKNDKVKRLEVDLGKVHTLRDLVDTAEGLVAMLRHKLPSRREETPTDLPGPGDSPEE